MPKRIPIEINLDEPLEPQLSEKIAEAAKKGSRISQIVGIRNAYADKDKKVPALNEVIIRALVKESKIEYVGLDPSGKSTKAIRITLKEASKTESDFGYRNGRVFTGGLSLTAVLCGAGIGLAFYFLAAPFSFIVTGVAAAVFLIAAAVSLTVYLVKKYKENKFIQQIIKQMDEQSKHYEVTIKGQQNLLMIKSFLIAYQNKIIEFATIANEVASSFNDFLNPLEKEQCVKFSAARSSIKEVKELLAPVNNEMYQLIINGKPIPLSDEDKKQLARLNKEMRQLIAERKPIPLNDEVKKLLAPFNNEVRQLIVEGKLIPLSDSEVALNLINQKLPPNLKDILNGTQLTNLMAIKQHVVQSCIEVKFNGLYVDLKAAKLNKEVYESLLDAFKMAQKSLLESLTVNKVRITKPADLLQQINEVCDKCRDMQAAEILKAKNLFTSNEEDSSKREDFVMPVNVSCSFNHFTFYGTPSILYSDVNQMDTLMNNEENKVIKNKNTCGY